MLLTKDVLYKWHDGVALIAQLIEQLRPFGAAAPSDTIPDLASVALESTGWLRVSPEPEREEPIMPGAAQLLQQLLSGTDQPPQLRLYVMQAATSEPSTPLGEFADELSKWERPNRVPKLVALHKRAVDMIGVAALSEEARTRQSLEATRVKQRRAGTGRDTAPPRRTAATPRAPSVSIFVGAAVVLVAGFIAALEWRYVLGRSAATPPSVAQATTSVEPPTPPSETVPPIAVARVPPAAPRMPDARTDPSTAPGAAKVDSAPVTTADEELTRAQTLVDQQDYANARVAFDRVLESSQSNPLPQSDEVRQAPRSLNDVTRAAVDVAPVGVHMEYRSGDPGVTPPVPEAYLPPEPDPRTPSDKLQVMELRINATGGVDSAKFVTTNHTTYRNAWWPAAAKTWHFKPAMKDGEAVSYVMRIVMDDSDPFH